MTIGNLPKEIRRKPSRGGQILLGYLPTSKLESLPTEAGRRRALANLFHACMGRILEPLKKAGVDGVEMRSGDGVLRRTHPIFAIFVGDYPEQLLVTCCKNGTCPKCSIHRDNIGSNSKEPLRDLLDIFEALELFDPDNPTPFAQACADAGIKPIQHPFWEELPYVNIFRSITSDILHQLYQGVVKHLISWITIAGGAVEIDARCRRLPPNHNLRHFHKGISTLSRVSGQEHADMCRILMGLVVDLPLKGGMSPVRLVHSVRALLDFLYIAQFPSQTDETLQLLQSSLDRFHKNKDIFIDLGIRTNFNIPKLHSLQHYVQNIKFFGTTDNYNTETSERLHIDLAKEAYRATNHKDEYPQMTLWLERKEKILLHNAYINWRLNGQQPPPALPPTIVHRIRIRMTHHPTLKAVHFDSLVSDYGAQDFRLELKKFITTRNSPDLTVHQVRQLAPLVNLPFQHLPVFHIVKFWLPDIDGRIQIAETLDVAHVVPSRREKKKDGWKPARFDTVLVKMKWGDEEDPAGGVHSKLLISYHSFVLLNTSADFRVVQIRAIFRIPEKANNILFNPGVSVPKHLAYVEWFSPFTQNPDRIPEMYKVARGMKDGKRIASIIPLAQISCSVLLGVSPNATMR
jgi:hypothetical protein